MSNPEQDRRIDYIEFPAVETKNTKHFYSSVFGWKFEDYGPSYAAFHDGRLAGGFQAGDLGRTSQPLVVIYAVDLEGAERAVTAAGGTITKAIFSFPGGRRFHFKDPNGNELAVWSEERA